MKVAGSEFLVPGFEGEKQNYEAPPAPELGTRNQKPETMLIDTHAHLDFPEFAQDLDQVVARARNAEVSRIVTIGTDGDSNRRVIELAERYGDVYAAVGIHPNSVADERDESFQQLERLLKHPKVVAVGETGLDYHYLPQSADLPFDGYGKVEFGESSDVLLGVEIKRQAFIAKQAEAFHQHLELASATGKAVVIHQRDAWNDTIDILREYAGRVRAVMHCFNGNTSQMQEVINLGYLVSFTGIVTFKNAAEVRNAAKTVPIDRIMVETDAPFLAPIPNRGKRCEPGFVRDTASFIADLRGMSLGDFAHHTTQNARRFFELD